MFLRCKTRRKDGKVHRSWSLVENRRVGGGRVVQRQMLYLGEINDSQQAAWRHTIEVFADGPGAGPGVARGRARQMALFPEGGAPVPGNDGPGNDGPGDDEVVQVRLGDLQLHRPRQWGGCWLACQLWDQLELDAFWSPRLAASRQGTRWLNVLKTLVVYRLQVTLKQRLRALAPGLTLRAVLEKLKAMQMIDVELPTTDGRHIVLPRYTQPNKDQQILLQQLKLALPPQPTPRITAQAVKSS